MSLETIRLSERGKQQLITLKKRTGIDNWNVLCRWAFCRSLAEPSTPPKEDIPSDSSVEMSFKVFAGEYQKIYLAILKQRAFNEGKSTENHELLSELRTHIHRGISFISNETKSISDLIEKPIAANKNTAV
ncbi:DNA sulfur modification protein DndE [Motiliproteus sediminis]|uniref:DNA sulfur modification protein DndE n=1 Tax=Motiliproteus sediminis TaxID=1468178 RepID=UPI001AEF3DCF|nr:DNA sulfur modification protein DndE [Motiliproteus sediminis]